jgi:two-component system NtrC family sensor kinase
LGVDNRKREQILSENHLFCVSTLADYAAIAVENASLYSHTVAEQTKFETILNNIEDGVIVIDDESRLVYINKIAGFAFGLDGQNYVGEQFSALFKHPDLLEMVGKVNDQESSRAEIVFEDGRVFNARLTPITNVGYAISMQDISYLKELDRIKSDFVNAVSHDLRSPLTAILGYVELIERAGEINEQQREFIERVQSSVDNITDLISDLLDLGRIESGFDVNKELISVSQIIRQVHGDYIDVATENQLELWIRFPEDLPLVFGNPTRLRQMLGNLVGNAVKYTLANGKIMVKAKAEGGQIIVQVTDNGLGIPLSEQTFIFDKFYRASNISGDTTGTGLGLAIVKSIVENHQGRIWVDSRLGQGTMFTVVLPVESGDLRS